MSLSEESNTSITLLYWAKFSGKMLCKFNSTSLQGSIISSSHSWILAGNCLAILLAIKLCGLYCQMACSKFRQSACVSSLMSACRCSVFILFTSLVINLLIDSLSLDAST